LRSRDSFPYEGLVMSDAIIDTVTKIDEKMDEVIVATNEAQKRQDKLEKTFDGLDVEAMKQAANDTTKAMQDIQDMKQSIIAIEKASEFMEKTVSRLGSSANDSENQEMEKKAKEEFTKYLRTGDAISEEVKEAVIRSYLTKAWYGAEDHAIESEVKTMLAGSNPEGGYFIRPERSATMITRIFESSPVRTYANVESTATDSLDFMIDDDEAQSGGWVGEVDTRGTTGTPKIGELSIPVHEQFSQPLATQKMLDDAGFDLEGWLSGKVTDKMSRTENTAFIVGDGARKPRGILTYPTWTVPDTYERNAIEQIASGAAATFTSDGLKAIQNALKEEYQTGAIWTLKRISFEDIITLKDSTGRYIFQSRFIDNRDEMRLLGKPVVFMNDFPAVAAAALALAYGNWQMGYTVVDRLGFRVIRDIFTQKPFIKFYTTKRVGGDVTNYESVKIQHTATVLP